jgi:bleomycin hydrolase
MLVNLVQKYGVVPKSVFPETKCCVASRRMNQFLKNKLRTYACRLRSDFKNDGATTESLRATKLGMMTEYHKRFGIFFGQPPDNFTWSFRDSKKNFVTFKNVTPLSFYQNHVDCKAENYVSLIHVRNYSLSLFLILNDI